MVKKQYIKAEIRTLDIETKCHLMDNVSYGGSNKDTSINKAETKRSMWDDEEW